MERSLHSDAGGVGADSAMREDRRALASSPIYVDGCRVSLMAVIRREGGGHFIGDSVIASEEPLAADAFRLIVAYSGDDLCGGKKKKMDGEGEKQ